MGRKSKTKRRDPDARQPASSPERTGRAKAITNCTLAFILGALLAGGGASLVFQHRRQTPSSANSSQAASLPDEAGRRNVAKLIALANDELEKVDVVEMNIAVAREIPGLEKLDYDKYRSIVDGWTGQFRRWLPTVEYAFHDDPSKYKNDINFFRLGTLAQFLDQQVGIAYIEEQKQEQLEDEEKGIKSQIAYTNPGDVLLHGLIDAKRGTCGTMPTLHVAIGRRLGWPVGLACVDSHYICRYDDGKVAYNLEATDTGRGGFGASTDQEYTAKKDLSQRAIAVGSDLRKLSAREVLGVFVQARARHLTDTNRPRAAARDYALAHTLFPNSRMIYIGLIGNLLPTGNKLFTRAEHGHPASLAAHLARLYGRTSTRSHFTGGVPPYFDPVAEAERVNSINRANMQGVMNPQTGPQPHQPHVPGHPSPGQPY